MFDPLNDVILFCMILFDNFSVHVLTEGEGEGLIYLRTAGLCTEMGQWWWWWVGGVFLSCINDHSVLRFTTILPNMCGEKSVCFRKKFWHFALVCTFNGLKELCSLHCFLLSQWLTADFVDFEWLWVKPFCWHFAHRLSLETQSH